jgi:hypothetical protein
VNVRVVVEISDKEYWSTINVGEASVDFDWPEGVPVPNLYAMVEGLSIEALRLHKEAKAESAKE